MSILYTDISANQRNFLNFPGGGLTTQPGQFNDPVLELGTLSEITAVYTMTGNEVQNDIINVARVPSGSLVNPIDGNVASEAVATTAVITVGDTDTQAGTVTADTARYSTSLNIAAGNTTVGFPFTGGTVLLTPAQITDDWVFITAKFTTLTVPVAAKKIIFRISVSSLD